MVTTQNIKLPNYLRTLSCQRDTKEGRAHTGGWWDALAASSCGTPPPPPKPAAGYEKPGADGAARPTPTWAVTATFDNPLQQPPGGNFKRSHQRVWSQWRELCKPGGWVSLQAQQQTQVSGPYPKEEIVLKISSLASLREEKTQGERQRQRMRETERQRVTQWLLPIMHFWDLQGCTNKLKEENTHSGEKSLTCALKCKSQKPRRLEEAEAVSVTPETSN